MGNRRGNKLEVWEVGLVKALINRNHIPQDIQAYFSRPSRSINHARISEIRDGMKHSAVKAASEEDLDTFLSAWPDVDPETGLCLRGDELLIKAREAMIAAIHTFNSAGLFFRAELFIVTCIIAWTYLMHAYYRQQGIDYRFKKNGVPRKTPNGAVKFWDLSKCLAHGSCPLEKGIVTNLRFLSEIRHEIEHRSTNRIDNAVSAKLQACCINFNDTIKELFGKKYGLEERLPIALQLVTFDGIQRSGLIGNDLPPNLAAAVDGFHSNLTEAEQNDPQFRYRVAFVPKLSGKVATADLAIEVVKAGSPEADAAEHILLKETERPKYRRKEVLAKAAASGYPSFNGYAHTTLVKQLNARDPSKGYGVWVAKTWYWYDKWVDKVLEKLHEGWTRR